LARVLAIAVSLIAGWAQAQTPAKPAAPPSARQAAPIDLTGQWVSIVNEDWRWRMLTPRKGDYIGVRLSAEGRKVADTWTAEEDGSCKAFGAGGLMRMPLRVRIDWETDAVLRISTDAGRQVRRLHFSEHPATGARTLQGRSIAEWERALPPGDGWGFGPGGPPPAGGSLKVLTTDLEPGWLRRNGVPYSENARVTEYYDRFGSPDGSEWFVVTTIVDDPRYLQEPHVTRSHFRREQYLRVGIHAPARIEDSTCPCIDPMYGSSSGNAH
jgi:hypothetical protein